MRAIVGITSLWSCRAEFNVFVLLDSYFINQILVVKE